MRRYGFLRSTTLRHGDCLLGEGQKWEGGGSDHLDERLINGGEQKPKMQKKNTINYHLMRLYPKIRGPFKRDK